MTKSSNKFRKYDKKTKIRKLKQLKYDFLNSLVYEDICSDNDGLCITYRQRVPSRQQYKRIRTETMKSDYESSLDSCDAWMPITKSASTEIKDDSKMIKMTTVDTKVNLESPLITRFRKVSCTNSNISTPPLSASFNVNPNWSDFDDSENMEFVSEINVDYQKVLLELGEYNASDTVQNEQLDMSEDGSSFVEKKSRNNWILELACSRLEHTRFGLQDTETKLRQYVSEIMHLRSGQFMSGEGQQDGMILFSITAEFRRRYVIAESILCLLRDHINHEDCEALQTQLSYWTEVHSNYMELDQIIQEVERARIHKEIYDNCLMQIQETIYAYLNKVKSPLANCDAPILQIQACNETLKKELDRIQSSVSKIAPDHSYKSSDFLVKLDNFCANILKDKKVMDVFKLLELLNKYLKKTENLCELELKLESMTTEAANKTNAEIKQVEEDTQNIMRVPVKVVMLLLMSIMCLFGNSEIENFGFNNSNSSAPPANYSTVERLVVQYLNSLTN